MKVHMVLIDTPVGIDEKKELINWTQQHGRGIPDGKGGLAIEILRGGIICELDDTHIETARKTWGIRILGTKDVTE